MHVWYFVDDTSFYPGNSGIQRVTRCLGSTLERLGVELRLLCWDVPSKDFRPLLNPNRINHLAQYHGPTNGTEWATTAGTGAIEGAWLIMPELVTHTLRGNLGQVIERARLRGMKVATIFYDAIPLKLTEFYDLRFRKLHIQYIGELLGSDLVLPISATSFNDLDTHMRARWGLNAQPRARRVMLELPGELLGSARVTTPLTPTNGPRKILCVGTVELRKNHIRATEAFMNVQRLHSQPIELIIVGGMHDKEVAARFAEFMKDKKGVTWMRKATDEQLAHLYRECAFTIYPSLEEGYGLPVMESIWNGKPCICNRDSATGEIARGGGCIAINTHFTDEMTVAMLRLLEDHAELERLSAEACARPIRSWQDYTRDLIALLAEQAEGVTSTPLPSEEVRL